MISSLFTGLLATKPPRQLSSTGAKFMPSILSRTHRTSNQEVDICVHVYNCSHTCIYMSLQGAQEVFRELPHEYVSPYDLKDVVENGGS